MATTVVTERALTSRNGSWAQPKRPWLTLYGLRVKPKQEKSGDEDKAFELAPIQKLLPEELLLKTFSLLKPYMLGKVACVTRHWNTLTQHSELWKPACLEAFQDDSPEKLERLLRLQYKRSWRGMFLQRPHLRFDGLYVSRNTYIRTGITEWRTKNPVHLVCYFRYLRFLPEGIFLYRTSPEVVSKVAKGMGSLPANLRPDEPLQHGRWQLKKEKLMTAMRYPNFAGTEIRSRLRLRSTTPGANNRLDVEHILSYDRFDGSTTSMLDLPDWDELERPDALSHRRGLAPYVFVPDDEVSTHILNQADVSKMDFFLPG